MRFRKQYGNILLILALALATLSYYTVRFDLPPALHQSSPLLNISFKPWLSFVFTIPSNSSNNQTDQSNNSKPDSGSTIIIEPSHPNNSSQTPASIIKLGVYEMDLKGGPVKPASAIDWSADGPIIPGQGRNSPVLYFLNEGNVPITMSLSSSNWSFKDSLGNPLSGDYRQYFSLTWNYDNSVLQLYQAKPVVLTLTVSPDLWNVATFSFDLVILVSG